MVLHCRDSAKHQKRLHQLHCVKQGISQQVGEVWVGMILLGIAAAALQTLECSNPHNALKHTSLLYKASEDHICASIYTRVAVFLTVFFTHIYSVEGN